MNKLFVLLWKHFVVRRRRFIHTPIEWLSPIVFFVLLFVFRYNINPVSKYNVAGDKIHFTEPIPITDIPTPNTVFFSPITNVTSRLMAKVGEKLELPKGEGLPGPNKVGYFPSYYDPNLQKTLIDLAAHVIIIFENINTYDTELPARLNYTIRTRLPYASIEDEHDDTPTYHTDYGTRYEKFVRVQWAVDSAFLELKTGQPIVQKVSMQEFPYVKSVGHSNVGVLVTLLIYLTYLSLLLPFVFLSTRLLAERASGIREMMHMVGVPRGLLHLSHFVNVVPAGLAFSVAGAALLAAGPNALLPFTNPFLVWLMLVLYFTNVIAIAYATSCVLKKTQYGVTFACLVYTALMIPANNVVNVSVPSWALPLAGLLPHTPMMWFWKNVAVLEVHGVGLTFANMARSYQPSTGSALVSYLLMLLQALLFGLLAWYLEQVHPGPYGQARPWHFLCQREFWSGKKVVPEDESEESAAVDARDEQHFEPAAHLRADPAGIHIRNVTKVFPKHKALSNVSMNIASGEITVLLGHNGAGKTTLMSIITGMLSPTEGTVVIEGHDAAREREAVRQQLGLCPQHNLFFSDLTVLEHVMFYTLLKGRSFESARKSSLALLSQLGLAEKKGVGSGMLSGGMKRRLQLACALAGDARVLVLDEPTSGLDVETRRGLWDLLLSLRGDRTVLISTHFMEEADALGDRVAALQAGRLRCFASPMYLKRALGTGYRLTCTTLGEPQETAITELVTSHVAGATLRERTLNSVAYALPSEQTEHFPKLFKDLEKRRSDLRVDTIGVGASTLEEVFLKLCSDTADVSHIDEVDGADGEPSDLPRYTGLKLLACQFWALFVRHFMYVVSNKWTFLVLQVLLPLLVIVGMTYASNNYNARPTSGPVPMDLGLYSSMTERKVLYNLNTSRLSPGGVEGWNPGVEATPTRNASEDILRTGVRDIMEYNKYLVGIEINDTDARMLYTTVRRHAAPVAANLLANTLGAALGAGPHAITTNNQPFGGAKASPANRSKDLDSLFLWAAMVVFTVMSTIINAVTLPCKERVSGTRHLQLLAGARVPMPWLAALAAHTLTYAAVLCVPVLIVAAAIDTDSTINQPDFLGVLFLTLIVGVLAFLAQSYLVSFWFGERGAGAILIAAVIVFGFITPSVSTVLDLAQSFTPEEPRGWVYYLVVTLGYLMPPHQFTAAVMRATYIASNNAAKRHPANSGVVKLCYMCFDEYAPAPTILILLGQFAAYMALVLLCEYGVFSAAWERVASAQYDEPDARDADDVVRAEAEYVRKAIDLHGGCGCVRKTRARTDLHVTDLHNLPVVDCEQLEMERFTDRARDQVPDALLAHNLHKKYTRVLGRSCNAVKGVSFSVKQGEVFGLLGVNGAGKSTIFKMLTGLERPTRGRALAAGRSLARARLRYLRALGYCPQFGGQDDFLTPGANLRLLLAMRGLAPDAARAEARRWLEAVGLTRFQGRPVSSLSGGCARRLAAAAALCAGGRVLLLDEPSAGVDVSARRLLWAALLHAAKRSAVVVSSHSMDETEALCGRIAIVAGGRVRALGSAAALRAQHAAGYALVLRVTPPRDGDETDGGATHVSTLKSTLQQTFNCTLKDEHKTMLHYHIDDSLPYSELFARLERVRAACPLLQDYAVAETTLEEVFLAFARDAAAPAPAHPTPV